MFFLKFEDVIVCIVLVRVYIVCLVLVYIIFFWVWMFSFVFLVFEILESGVLVSFGIKGVEVF